MNTPTTRLIVGCGYLGRRVAARWVGAGDTVFALTRSRNHADELTSRGIQPIIGDVLDRTTLASLPTAKTVLHAVGYDRTSDVSKRDIYVDGLRNVLTALPSAVERFVYVSSTSVYGQSEGEKVDESSPCAPTTESGRICLDAENVVRDTLTNRMSPHVLRLSGIYGPDRLIARIDGLRAGRPLQANPHGWLNLIHVDDATTAVLACSDSRVGDPSVTLVTDDRPLQRRNYYEALARLVSAPVPKFEIPSDDSPNLGKRCNNRRLREDWDITLTFPSIETGLPHAVGEVTT